MASRYHGDSLIERKEIDVYECPDCGFEFNAVHEMDDGEGGYICPTCETEELESEVDRLNVKLDAIRKLTEGDSDD
jgi:DNA-directed RNA polymerase subunit RPC12/RpoP